jgi:ribosomal protein S18 acetylase RimI-like enzyme
MSSLTPTWKTKRCLIREAQELDFNEIASILTDNLDALKSQGREIQLESLVRSLLRHDDLPPNGHPSNETTTIIANKSTREAIGVFSFYRGYPTDKTIYIGSLFLFKKYQRQGFGREIIEDFKNRIREAGYGEIRVAIALKNWSALRFWVALGFNRIAKISGDKNCSDTTYANIELIG